jgi:MFS family permease
VAGLAPSTRTFRWLLVYQVSQHSPLYWPYMFLFVTSVRGLPASDFGLLKSIYYFAVMLIDVPLGVVADRLGRRVTLLAGAIANALGCALYAFGDGFAAYAAAELAFALTSALQSGADSALLYDAYAADGRAHEFARAAGTRESVGLIGATAAFALAGLFVSSTGDATAAFVATGALSLAGVVAILAVREPPRSSPLRAHQHVAAALRDLSHTRGLIATMLYGALVYAALRAANALVWNPVLEAASVPVGLFGALTAVVSLLGAYTAWQAPAWQARLGGTALALLASLSVSAMYALLALSPGVLGGPLIASHGLALGILPVLITDALNRRIESSERRATVLSFESVLNRGSYGLIVYAAATGIDRYGLAAVLVGFALLSAASLALVPRMIQSRSPARG